MIETFAADPHPEMSSEPKVPWLPLLHFAARHPESAIHAAADKHLAQLSVAARYAFAMGRKALGKNPANAANAARAAAAVKAALLDVLPSALLKPLAAGGQVALDELPRLKAAGDVEGHEFHGNQYTNAFGTTDKYVYHISDPALPLSSFEKHGIKPSTEGYSGPGVYMAHTPEKTQYYQDLGEGRLFRIDKQKLIEKFGKYPENKDGVEYDDGTGEVILGGNRSIPSEFVEVQHSSGEWRPLKAPKALAGPLTMKFDVSNPAAIAWAKEHAGELAVGISDTTEKAIQDAVAQALEDGEDPTDAIEAAVGDADRAELIARTEVMTAANEGQRQAWDQATEAGLLTGDEQAVWIATEDACPECEALDGETRSLDGEYPDDGGDGPPLHPNCRCTEGLQ